MRALTMTWVTIRRSNLVVVHLGRADRRMVTTVLEVSARDQKGMPPRTEKYYNCPAILLMPVRALTSATVPSLRHFLMAVWTDDNLIPVLDAIFSYAYPFGWYLTSFCRSDKNNSRVFAIGLRNTHTATLALNLEAVANDLNSFCG